ncbi:maleylpyruvate isomerase family mycothiol-dependent enzyme [Embleya sp. NBC_00896]|uniref:maleylpyruvate isomerase family mycothiol-dependent enzyme n=1 Tax=Embleya sp. NBC_00896 TaxID=2975961 RepID=UPI002F916FB6|nr:maleylpyruvate isomerase family mycothiol-dependent enzyme [Embleya sp. NBC_00896]
MDFDRHCAEIVHQTELLTTDLATADLRAPVPSCPGWSLGNLVRHIGGGHRWAEQIVRTRATDFLPDDQVRKLDGDDSAKLPVDWLLEGATRFAETLRAAGPDAEVWAPFDYATTSFWARRFTHESLVHRADATLAAGTGFVVSPDLALDAIDEWMELDALPQHFDYKPQKRELLGPGRTLGFEATDTEAAWFVDLTGDVIVWRRGTDPAPAAAAVRGSLTDLLLVIYRRKAVPGEGIEILGDTELLDSWLGHVAFA